MASTNVETWGVYYRDAVFGVASDGTHVYVLSANGLLKIGTGAGASAPGVVYATNPTLVCRGSIACVGNRM